MKLLGLPCKKTLQKCKYILEMTYEYNTKFMFSIFLNEFVFIIFEILLMMCFFA